MPPQTFEAFFRSLKKAEPSGAYYFHGAEDVLKDEAAQALLDRTLDPSLRDFNFDQRSTPQLDPESLYTLCATLPMMAERRVVVLREIEGLKRKPKVRAALLAYLARPAPETVLLMVQGSGEESEDKELSRLAVSVACDALPPERVRKWLQHRADSLGIRLEADAADHLMRAVGSELGPLQSELQKLSALPTDQAVTADVVGQIVGVRHGETVFDWRDALFDGRTGDAVRLLPRLLDQPGSSAVKLVTMTGTTLVGVGIARSHYDRRLRARALDDAVFETIRRNRVFGLLSWSEEKSRWVRWAALWTPARLSAGLRATLAADTALKGTTISDEVGILSDMVLRMGSVKKTEAA
jgi:DNA polymerase III subunit delta